MLSLATSLGRSGLAAAAPAAVAARRITGCSAAAAPAGEGGMRDSQDPNKTWEAYSNEPEGRAVPGPEAEGVERKVVLGENIPASAEQAKEELKYAGKGLAQSVEQAAGVLLSKAKDAMAGAQRAAGMESDRPEMSAGTMGAAGKMEHAPPGAGGGGVKYNADAKYQEIAGTEKPHFPEGERSVQDMFPEMATAAGEQSNTPDRQKEENERIRREMRGHGGGSAGGGEAASGTEVLPSQDDPLFDSMHNRGP
ncbi:hypothetical protein C2E20_5565 [Micractinium conductrix]|uniref:Uncharacterized protein n=1 Tax=Micractinium conductrix TaxID=554055 RepID=A0A2P6VAE0_9CHLO|nr:hypothetical protein C2E20_5565 [Micractinium conductrix]|eukprot:PSC71063.1 hypothetical protein C2E20_5565 [Micractinium conductrix]